MKKIIIINGPNLNLLGKREPSVYGSETFEHFLSEMQSRYANLEISYFQSNVEGELISKLHEVGFSYDGIVLNAAGYTHTSIAIADAIRAIKTPVVEVHISNVFAREAFRHHSWVAGRCVGSISGLGLEGYRHAVDFLINRK